MGIKVRSVISMKGKYYIPKHRYLELKHFCMQYYDFVASKRYLEEVYIPSRCHDITGIKSSEHSDTTFDLESKLLLYNSKILIIEETCREADKELYDYILEAVTKGTPFSVLEARGIPCSKNTFYDRYRKFFWLLSNKKQ